MAGETRMPTEPVINTLAAMAAAPWEHDFFQALRRIECEAVDKPRLGHSVRLADDPLRLGQTPDCGFAPSTLSAVEPASEGVPPRVEQFFFGLTGPNGPLPLHLTEYARERQRNENDPGFKRFMDIFHHRLLTLFYRAWAEARPSVSHDRPDDDYWSARLAALSGRGMDSLLGQGPIPDQARYYYTGHLAAPSRYPDGLKVILSEYFELPVAIEEYVGQWLELPEHSRLGAQASTLGMDVCLGTHVWDRQHKFRLKLGPMPLDKYERLLPGGELFRQLAAWVGEYLGQELDWDVNLVLSREEVPPLNLAGTVRLGFNAWLGDPGEDAKDLLLASQYAGDRLLQRPNMEI
ncbi:MAG: type VI secretion system baseplate subunit TssG [Pseudomonas sp.]|uniref:type VI secretion system baseplate subunit TssG n=1 Tax=Pseudomonas sp. TaxID=306 RepID=UPI0030F289BF